ncbi:hypothetical protein RHMOL_Rhmol01G0175300 [Rhododendron molle]|uniref:Uncharacterized protein n=1 Tax=Rhododendron molle TaxID=49168 RepID=A0ACC0Q3W1_RHOML|nr:hypothetical protein RHMOL_Rhmol01G0175300 [Rhododendron molle]
MASLDRNDENLTTSLLKVTALEKSLSAAGERFIFMQKLRDFVSVICDFLQGPSILMGLECFPATMLNVPKLQPLVDYLLTLEKTLQKKHVLGVSEGKTSGLARQLKKMLVELNEYDHARAISRTFNLKEAL